MRFKKTATPQFSPWPEAFSWLVRRNSARPGGKPVFCRRVLDCGGKRSATPLSHAR
jgi:hypothetical protein